MSTDNKIYECLDNVWKKGGKRRRIHQKLVCEASSIFNGGYKKGGPLMSIFHWTKMIVYLLVTGIWEQIEKMLRKQYLCKWFNSHPKEIAMDENDLLAYRESTRCYGDTFTYSVVTTKSYLKNIEVIFGDAHLEALDDITCLASLVKVAGVIYYNGKRYADLSEIN